MHSAIKMLDEIEITSEMLFGDTGFDDKRPKKYRKKALEIFDKELYKRFRGIIEGIFGGLETRRLLFTRYKKNL